MNDDNNLIIVIMASGKKKIFASKIKNTNIRILCVNFLEKWGRYP